MPLCCLTVAGLQLSPMQSGLDTMLTPNMAVASPDWARANAFRGHVHYCSCCCQLLGTGFERVLCCSTHCHVDQESYCLPHLVPSGVQFVIQRRRQLAFASKQHGAVRSCFHGVESDCRCTGYNTADRRSACEQTQLPTREATIAKLPRRELRCRWLQHPEMFLSLATF